MTDQKNPRKQRNKLPCVYSATCNNPVKVPVQINKEFGDNSAVGLRYQTEKGDVEGTIHYQIGIYFNRPRTFANAVKYLRNLMGKHCHVIACTTLQHARNVYNYATKEHTRLDGPWELGTHWPLCISAPETAQPGLRTDLATFKEDSKTKSKEELEVMYPDIEARYPKFFDKYATKKSPTEPPNVIVLSGPSGFGKGKSVFDQDPDAIECSEYPTWYDPYRGQRTVILPNFRISALSKPQDLDKFLTHIDRNAAALPIKGGFASNRVHNWVITTVEDPDTWFDKSPTRRTEFFRRVTTVWRVTPQNIPDSDLFGPSTWQQIDIDYIKPEPPVTCPIVLK